MWTAENAPRGDDVIRLHPRARQRSSEETGNRWRGAGNALLTHVRTPGLIDEKQLFDGLTHVRTPGLIDEKQLFDGLDLRKSTNSDIATFRKLALPKSGLSSARPETAEPSAGLRPRMSGDHVIAQRQVCPDNATY